MRLFTNHFYVLAALHEDPDARRIDLANRIGITEGRVGRLLRDLADDGYITVVRDGRRNHYQLNPNPIPRHPLAASVDLNLNAFLHTDRKIVASTQPAPTPA
jgi:DNA-binding IclR family transcriptional regulator